MEARSSSLLENWYVTVRWPIPLDIHWIERKRERKRSRYSEMDNELTPIVTALRYIILSSLGSDRERMGRFSLTRRNESSIAETRCIRHRSGGSLSASSINSCPPRGCTPHSRCTPFSYPPWTDPCMVAGAEVRACASYASECAFYRYQRRRKEDHRATLNHVEGRVSCDSEESFYLPLACARKSKHSARVEAAERSARDRFT